MVTFSVYAIIAVFWKNETLLTAQAFTSVALISLLTTPVVVFIQALPLVVQSIASFDRIQEYESFGWDKKGVAVLKNVTVNIPGGSVTVVAGPVLLS